MRQINWPEPRSNEPVSPFSHGIPNRPIRIAFHTSSFHQGTEEEQRAIQVLRELARPPDIEAIDTAPGSLALLEIRQQTPGATTIPITVTNRSNRKTMSSIRNAESLYESLLLQVKQRHTESVNREEGYQDFLVARAIHHLEFDILLTLSPFILLNRDNSLLECANPRRPLETLKIVGLLLRARGMYIFEAAQNYFLVRDRGEIYREFLKHKLPETWRIGSACAGVKTHRRPDTGEIAESILVCCKHALHARDEIGVQFYIPQSTNSRDAIMYHFRYLTLLLTNVFDAQGRVVPRKYGIDRPAEEHRAFSDLMTLLKKIRNSIHGALWPTITYEKAAENEESFVKVPITHQNDLWEAAQRLGSPDRWGLLRFSDSILLLEPYTYAVNLVDECFRQIDAISASMDVPRDDYSFPEQHGKVLHEVAIEEFVRQRVALLG